MRPHSRLTAHQSQKFIEQRKMRTVTIVALSVLALAIWSFDASKFSHLSALTIDNINVTGTDDITASNLQAAVIDSLDGDYLELFARANTVFYPHDDVIAKVEIVSPQVKYVHITRNGLHGLDVAIEEKQPEAVICADLPELSSNDLIIDESSNCYYADYSGYLFKVATATTTDKYPRYFIPSIADSVSTSTNVIVGNYATSTKLFSDLQSFYAGAINSGMKALAIFVRGDGEYEMYARNHSETDDAMVIYFNSSRPFNEQLDNLRTFYEKSVSKSNTNFEYIDVRYGSNVFYRKIQ